MQICEYTPVDLCHPQCGDLKLYSKDTVRGYNKALFPSTVLCVTHKRVESSWKTSQGPKAVWKTKVVSGKKNLSAQLERYFSSHIPPRMVRTLAITASPYVEMVLEIEWQRCMSADRQIKKKTLMPAIEHHQDIHRKKTREINFWFYNWLRPSYLVLNVQHTVPDMMEP